MHMVPNGEIKMESNQTQNQEDGLCTCSPFFPPKWNEIVSRTSHFLLTKILFSVMVHCEAPAEHYL